MCLTKSTADAKHSAFLENIKAKEWANVFYQIVKRLAGLRLPLSGTQLTNTQAKE